MKLTQCYDRRRFMVTAAESAAFAAIALTLKPCAVTAAARASQLTFYDPRFAASEPLARELSGAGVHLLSTHGDPTELVLGLTGPESLTQSPRWQGVTTESIPFCLHHLKPGSRLTQRRLDRDLFVWLIQGP